MDYLPFAHQLVLSGTCYSIDPKIKIFRFIGKMGYKQKSDTIIGKAGIARPQWDKITNSSNILLEGERKEQGTGVGPSIEDAEIRWHFWYPRVYSLKCGHPLWDVGGLPGWVTGRREDVGEPEEQQEKEWCWESSQFFMAPQRQRKCSQHPSSRRNLQWMYKEAKLPLK